MKQAALQIVRIFLASIFVFGLTYGIALYSPNVWACSGMPYSYFSRLEEAKNIGEFVVINNGSPKSNVQNKKKGDHIQIFGERTVQLELIQVLRGAISQKIFTIKNNPTMCDVSLEKGQKLILAVHEASNQLQIDMPLNFAHVPNNALLRRFVNASSDRERLDAVLQDPDETKQWIYLSTPQGSLLFNEMKQDEANKLFSQLEEKKINRPEESYEKLKSIVFQKKSKQRKKLKSTCSEHPKQTN